MRRLPPPLCRPLRQPRPRVWLALWLTLWLQLVRRGACLNIEHSGSADQDAIDWNHLECYRIFEGHFNSLVKAHRPRRAVVFDVGANDGQWTKWVDKLVRFGAHRAHHHPPLPAEYHLFEPQPRFAPELETLRQSLSPRSTLNRVAVWTDDRRNMTFYLSRSSISASLVPVVARHAGMPRRGDAKISVRTLDLAAFLKDRLPARPNASKTLAVLKLDVEAAEFELLPHLITSGALCRVHIFIIEWHLNALPPEKRLAALGLRMSVSTLLRTGCAATADSAPIMVHEGAPTNNWEQRVPGLWEVAQFHNGTPVPGELPSRLVRRWDDSRREVENMTRVI